MSEFPVNKKSIVEIYSKKTQIYKSHLYLKVKQYVKELLLIFTTNKYLHQNKIKENRNFLGHKRQVNASDSVGCYYSILRSEIGEFQSTQLANSKLPRRTYLVAYSQADLTKFSTRKRFGKCIKKHFKSGSWKVKV